MRGRRSSVLQIAVLSGMALLLANVAILQYKWATQLSAATEVRLGSNLQALMTRWDRDFYDELSAVCIALQVGPDSGAHDGWNDYLQRYAEWAGEGGNHESGEAVYTNRELVQEIYAWQTSVPEKLELLRLNPDSKALEAVKAPRELQALLLRLQANSSDLRTAMRAWEFPSAPQGEQSANSNRPGHTLRSNALAGWQLDDKIPALVHPVVHHANPLNSLTPIDRAKVDWLVVVLDSNVIQNRILPELARRNFGGPDGLEYKLAVVAAGDDQRVIYSSDPSLRVDDVSSFDSVMYIFGSPLDGVSPGAGQVKRARNSPEQDWRIFSGPVWFPVIQYGSHTDSWILLFRHRTGTVGTIARSMGYRDLIIGGVVLLLLAANVVLVFFLSYRAQKLAKLQLLFTASASHELLTPLSAIYCTGQNFRDGLVQTKSDLMTHGSIVTSQARQLIDLVKQNLRYAATESGMNRYTLRPLHISEIFDSVRENIAIMVEESGCTIEYDIHPGLPKVMADLIGLAECLQNLVGNAIKYSGKNGRIRISASVHEMTNDAREVRISVQDHGAGISSSELPHIFEPFYRSPKVVEAQIHGTGLGLTVADRIAKAMGGRLSAMSELGVGSIFTLHLPVRKSEAEMRTRVVEVT